MYYTDARTESYRFGPDEGSDLECDERQTAVHQPFLQDVLIINPPIVGHPPPRVERAHVAVDGTKVLGRIRRSAKFPRIAGAPGDENVQRIADAKREQRRSRSTRIETPASLSASARQHAPCARVNPPLVDAALFYGSSRRRKAVVFDVELRALIERVAADTRSLLEAGDTPPPEFEARKCNACSLKEVCQPQRARRMVHQWLAQAVED